MLLKYFYKAKLSINGKMVIWTCVNPYVEYLRDGSDGIYPQKQRPKHNRVSKTRMISK